MSLWGLHTPKFLIVQGISVENPYIFAIILI